MASMGQINFGNKISVYAIPGQNANGKMPTPETPVQKVLPPTQNTKISGITNIGVLSMAL